MRNKYNFKQSYEDKPKVLDLYVYGDIKGEGSLNWSTWEYEESKTSAKYFKEQLEKYDNLDQINLYVNTYGGSVYEGTCIRNQLKRKNCKVVGYVDGIAASAGSFILTACDEVKMYSNTMQMIHNMWNFAVGNAKELRKAADDLDKMMEGNRQAYLEKSKGKLTEEKLIELLDNESMLTAQECLEYGLCDEIIDEEVDLDAANQMMQSASNTIMQRFNYNKAMQKAYMQSFNFDTLVKENNQQSTGKKELVQETEQSQEVEEPKQVNNFMRLKQKFMKEGNK